jgi:hypothetical protein
MNKKIIFFLIVTFCTILVIVFGRPREAFGTSPGTMVQLQTSHVPTQEDYTFYTNQYPKLVRREVTALTGDDPGELRPWIFPWYGRGVSLIAQ